MPKLQLSCEHCHVAFERWPSAPAKYCSRDCWKAATVSTFDYAGWHKDNRVDQNAKKSAWRKANPEKRLAIQRKWRAANKATIAANGGMRREAIKAGVDKSAVTAVLTAADGHCTYCDGQFERLELDHIDSLAFGGKHALNNFLPACRSCNASKSDKDAAEWIFEKHGINGLVRAVYMLENRQRWTPEASHPGTVITIFPPKKAKKRKARV
ncbi:HNH endonuclease [Sphingomonas paeninsulae]|uniref:HNH endonuclease n=1 Tax=Sphingomonas paeninsulae TaxID=2319844 RepID=A0A494TDS6_SPHPE|nr:HNH endonuclease [Sphingomonas paeninsulae]AYJ87647.1 HNH endonuclease [Sphingomonas paeninsulae]